MTLFPFKEEGGTKKTSKMHPHPVENCVILNLS